MKANFYSAKQASKTQVLVWQWVDLEDAGVGENGVEKVHVVSQRKGVNDKVLMTGRQLHETCEALVAPERVVLHGWLMR